jgi:hypothetical protein
MMTTRTTKDRAALSARLAAMRQGGAGLPDPDTIPPDVLRGYIAAQALILARTDLTPCRRRHHTAKRDAYAAMLLAQGETP